MKQLQYFPLVVVAAVAVAAIFLLVSAPESPTGAAIGTIGDVPSGYAPPWDVWTNEEFLFSHVLSLSAMADKATLLVRVNRPDAYIYRYFYLSEKGKWKRYEFSESGWERGEAMATIEVPTANLDAYNYVLAYTCKKNAEAPDGWDCGCKSTTDESCRSYAIQHFPDPTLPPPDCLSDDDCFAPTPVCDLASGSCIADSCTPATEVCTGGLDEDCDGAIDCADSDCAGAPACTGGAAEQLALLDMAIVYRKDHISTCGQQGPGDSPAVGLFAFNPDTGVISTTNYLGMSSFKTNGLQQISASSFGDKNFFVSQSIGDPGSVPTNCEPADCIQMMNDEMEPCKLKQSVDPNPFCIGTYGDCGATRTWGLSIAGEDYVYTRTTTHATHNSKLLFSGEGSSFSLVGEFADPFFSTGTHGSMGGIYYPDGEIHGRQGGGVVYFGSGISNKAGSYTTFFKTASKLYGILLTDSGREIIDLTSINAPVSLGAPGTELSAVLNTIGDGTLASPANRRVQVQQEKIVAVEDAGTFTVYDYNDPTAVTVVDSFPNNLATIDHDDYAGKILAKEFSLVWREGSTLYLVIPANVGEWGRPGGATEDLIAPGGKSRLYKHVIGSTTGWEPFIDLKIGKPGVSFEGRDFQFFDGKLFTMQDDGTLNAYDLTTGTEILSTTLPFASSPDPAYPGWSITDNWQLNDQSFGVTKKGDTYYLYQIHASRTPPSSVMTDDTVLIRGYKIGVCVSGDCTSGVDSGFCDAAENCKTKTCGASDGCGGYCQTQNGCSAMQLCIASGAGFSCGGTCSSNCAAAGQTICEDLGGGASRELTCTQAGSCLIWRMTGTQCATT